MGILVGKKSKVIVQGFTGKEGSFHAEQCINYGTNLVGGVTPGKGGQKHLDRPVFDSVEDAVKKAGADVSLIFVPPMFAAEAIMEAADAGIKLAVCITEGIPAKDMLIAKPYAARRGMKFIGPNCPGIVTSDEAKVGIMPGFIFKKGPVGVISKSGTLTYEAVNQVVKAGLGVTTAIGIGGDPIIGMSYIELLTLFEQDPETKAMVMIGEIGGTLEIEAADFIKQNLKKPVVSFIAGQTAPKGKRMGHAGAIISGGKGTAAEKMEALKAAGVGVAENPAEIGTMIAKVMKK